MPEFIAALDQGTTSTRCIIFDHSGTIISSSQKEHQQFYPRPGWVEHDPAEIWDNAREVVTSALAEANLSAADIASLGITNQRETTVMWDRETGEPVYPAVVWQDTRTEKICSNLAAQEGPDRFRKLTGLPLSTYFSGPKINWIINNVPDLKGKVNQGKILFGNIDSWLIWNLTGGPAGGRHVTDVSNASRTLLMDLAELSWDDHLLETMQVPGQILPEICSSSEVYGHSVDLLPGVPISGILGDQQAALFGQTCFEPGDAKNTYGTGCFLLLNTGEIPTFSDHGLLTTLGYRLGNKPPVYALEGSIAIAGALVQWLRDNLGIIESAPEVETLATAVDENGGIYFVPAFSGLYAPHWRSDARGVIVGLTRFITKEHIARAALEATAYQTYEILEAMEKDSGVALSSLMVDGGMVQNEFLMQFQADLLDVPVIRPTITETTALGAAYAAGLAVNFWEDLHSLKVNWKEDKQWSPAMSAERRNNLVKGWKKAVTRSYNWVE